MQLSMFSSEELPAIRSWPGSAAGLNKWSLRRDMNKPIDELVTYADHTQGCMVGAGHDMCTCGYDDAEGKAQAAWEAIKAENERLRADAERYRWICRFLEKADALNGCDGTGDGPSFRDLLSDAIDAALSAVPNSAPAQEKGK